MTPTELEHTLKKLVGELAMVRAQNTLLTIFLDRLDGFSREQFETEFKSFWESQGSALTQSYWQGLETGLS
jgi:hypothetical protein